jgi:hypothetical protein
MLSKFLKVFVIIVGLLSVTTGATAQRFNGDLSPYDRAWGAHVLDVNRFVHQNAPKFNLPLESQTLNGLEISALLNVYRLRLACNGQLAPKAQRILNADSSEVSLEYFGALTDAYESYVRQNFGLRRFCTDAYAFFKAREMVADLAVPNGADLAEQRERQRQLEAEDQRKDNIAKNVATFDVIINRCKVQLSQQYKDKFALDLTLAESTVGKQRYIEFKREAETFFNRFDTAEYCRVVHQKYGAPGVIR